MELDSLSGEVDKILAGNDSDVLDELLKLNGSSGGARPKIVAYVSDDRQKIIHGGANPPEQIRLPGLRRGSLSFPNGTIS